MANPTALQLAHSVETGTAPQSLFLARILADALPLVRTENRATGESSLEELGADEAAAWLAARGIEEPAPGATTLASLYARAEGLGDSAKASIGFGD